MRFFRAGLGCRRALPSPMKLSELGRGQTVGRCMSRFIRTPVAGGRLGYSTVPWTVSPAKLVIAVPLGISAGSGSTRCWQSVTAVFVSGRIGSHPNPTSVPRDSGSASLGSNHCPPANLTRCFDDLRADEGGRKCKSFETITATSIWRRYD
jgi:hypothetical protein